MKLMREARGQEGAQRRPFRKLAIAAAVLLSAASLSLVGICAKSALEAADARREAVCRAEKLERAEWKRERWREFDSAEVVRIALTLQARELAAGRRVSDAAGDGMRIRAALDEYEREWDEFTGGCRKDRGDEDPSLQITRFYSIPESMDGPAATDLGPRQRVRDSLLLLKLMKGEGWAGEVKRGLEQEKIILWNMDAHSLRELARDLRIARFENVEDSLEKHDSMCMFSYVGMMPTVYTVRRFIGTPADVRLQKRQIRGILDGFEARAPRQRAEDSVMLLRVMEICWNDWFTKRENDHYEYYK
ncbi:MAG: hypothetical protein PHV13_02475 [Candidatus ainarchaeum sp.]|nr:hypothetical protein [Candidatus ainarchaeum sp.]